MNALSVPTCLTNHVHPLLTPSKVNSAGLLMKNLGQRYVQYVNRTYARTGTLWEGRFRSFLAQEETYLLVANNLNSKMSRLGLIAISLLPIGSLYLLIGAVGLEPIYAVAFAILSSIVISGLLLYVGQKSGISGLIVWTILFVLLMPISNVIFSIYLFFAIPKHSKRDLD